MSYNISKYDAIEQVKRLRIDGILSYMPNLHPTSENRIKWVTEFIQYLENDYLGNHSGLRACTAEFNRHYWIPKYKNDWSEV